MAKNWKDQISTPALIVDYEKLKKNIDTMAKFAKENNVFLRPHIKTHKCPEIGKMQLKAGANGICVARVGEAEVFADNGFDDILIANEVIVPSQIQRVMKLSKRCLLRVCVDSEKNIIDLNRIAKKNEVNLEVLINLDVGMGREGYEPGEPTLKLAKKIAEMQNLTLVGLQAYEGHLTPMMNLEQKKTQTEECMKKAVDTRDLLNNNGFDIDYISTSGSGTYSYAAKVKGITEIQPGTYPLSDHHLSRVSPEIEIAATVLGTISNQTGKKLFTVDAGLKAVPTGDGKPEFKECPKCKIRVMSEEHTQFKAIGAKFEIGQKIELIPAHICITVNLYDFLTVIKGREKVERWEVSARGKNY